MKRSLTVSHLSVLLVLALGGPPGASAATYTVTNGGDTASGGTLRWAVQSANANPGADTIAFNLPAPYFIQRTGDMPHITEAVAIDGATQPGYAGTPLVHLCGKQAGLASGHGLHIQADTCTVKGLIVSAFYQIGVYLDYAEHCTIQGNYLMSNTYGGVYLVGASDVLIGGTNALARNVISANGENGVQSVAGGSNIVIIGNYIGTDAAGLAAAPNGGTYPYHGVNVGGGARNVRIGGTNAGEGNVISGNEDYGIYCLAITGLVVQGNYLGTDVTGSNAIGNDMDGVCISGVSNVIGSLLAAGRNIISGNGDDGVQIFGEASRGNVVLGNYIGTDPTGLIAVTNRSRGVNIWDAPSNTIGGSVAGARNIIGATQWETVYIVGTSAVGNVVRGNYIGTDVTGSKGFRGEDGVSIYGAQETVIGGTNGGEGNLISGARFYGIYADDEAAGTVVQGNYIGTDASGTLVVSNGYDGIYLAGPASLVGGTSAAARNVISGNGSYGVCLWLLDCVGNVIQGNYIGTDVTGSNALPNGGGGIQIIQAPGNTIGGSGAGAGNLISGNGSAGIDLYGTNVAGTVIQGNLIGTDASGTNALANSGHGILAEFEVNGVTVGGTAAGAGNVIAHNEGDGIRLTDEASTGNTFLRNHIFSNKGMGVDLYGNGPDWNDNQDPDTGPNNWQNYPVLTSVSNNGANLLVKGTLNSTPNSAFRVEFFGSMACDVSGYGEGETHLGYSDVKTDGSGNGGFTNSTLVTPSTPPNFITATATDTNTLDTSEFSKQLLLDSDGDTMGDGYEHVNFGGYTNGSPTGDADLDRVSNLDEFLADTDPWNAVEYPRIVSFTNAGPLKTVSCPSSANRVYWLERGTNLLMSTSWAAVGSEANGSGDEISFEDSSAAASRFYRVRIRLP